MSMLPETLAREIGLALASIGGIKRLSELRIRRDGLSTILVKSRVIKLGTVVTKSEIDGIVERICGGALYAHRDSIAEGYVSLNFGIRVGICGRAAYDGGRLVGVRDVSSLVFRIPCEGCAFENELYRIFLSGIGQGMLIYSPPGVGKTTALRSLAKSAGCGGYRVVVVDERCEFSLEDYRGAEVDILRGYHRREGIEIATRTLSPDLIMVDELSGREAQGVSEVARCGIPLIATVHALDFNEIRAKPSLSPLISCGAFSVACGISREGTKYTLRTDNL